jgi:lactobin A/cerein 7B family class IIb bacteriocin
MHEISIEDIEKVNGGCPPCAVAAVVSLVESGATVAGAAAAIYSAYRYIRG